ncbi:hypothetical protein FXO38_26119 [Capsicum annuum]|nr:hypothetical protein FXO38_26119 [Capsicum annuum]
MVIYSKIFTEMPHSNTVMRKWIMPCKAVGYAYVSVGDNAQLRKWTLPQREAEDLAEVEAQLDTDLKDNGGATKDKNQIDVVNDTRIRRALRRVSFTILKISDVDSVDRSTHGYSKDGIIGATSDAVSVYHYGQGQAYAIVTGRNSYLGSYHLYILSITIAALGIVDLLYGLSGDCFMAETFKTVIILPNQKNVDLAVEIRLCHFFCLQQHGHVEF